MITNNDLMQCMYVYVLIQESSQSSLTGGHPDIEPQRLTKENFNELFIILENEFFLFLCNIFHIILHICGDTIQNSF